MVPQKAVAEPLVSGAVAGLLHVSVVVAVVWYLFGVSVGLAVPLAPLATECVNASPCCLAVLSQPAKQMPYKLADIKRKAGYSAGSPHLVPGAGHQLDVG